MSSGANGDKPTTAESLIMMRGSKIYDGHPFWPWVKDPTAQDFQEADFRDTYHYRLSGLQREILSSWQRPSARPGAWQESLDAKLDLVQDVTNDCSIVASLCVINARAAKLGSGDDSIYSKILHPFSRPSSNGKYFVKLHFNGCWRKVVIDDYLPASTNDQLIHVTARDKPDVVWPALVEKALLKVMGGYDFPGSDSGNDLWVLAGWIPERIYLPSKLIGPLELWQRIALCHQNGDVMITLGTPKLSLLEENLYGLASGHDYAVIDMKEEGDAKQLRIKNPWSRASDHLRAAQNNNAAGLDVILEENSENEQASLPSPTSDMPGTRWMSLHDVFQQFETIYLSWNPAILPYRRDVHFTYKLSERLASKAFAHSPQYTFESQSKCTVWLLLSRHIRPSLERDDSKAPGYIALFAFRGSERILVNDRAASKTSYVNNENVLLQLEVEANQPYTIVAAEQDVPGDALNFTLTAFSTKKLPFLRPAPCTYEHTSVSEGAWRFYSSGGPPSSPNHHLNPQYALTVPAQADVALLLSTPQKEYAVNVKVVHAKGKSIGPNLPNRDIYASSGEYRRECALAEVKRMNPGVYTVVCSLFNTKHSAPFKLHLYSSVPGCTLKECYSEEATMFQRTLTPVIFKQGVDRVLCPVKVAMPCKLKANAQASTSAKATRSPLRVALEYGQGPDKQILASSGDPVSAKTITTTGLVSVQAKWCVPPMPGVWLVVERVGGSFVRQDEKINVDVFHELPGFETGPWGQEMDLSVEEVERRMKGL